MEFALQNFIDLWEKEKGKIEIEAIVTVKQLSCQTFPANKKGGHKASPRVFTCYLLPKKARGVLLRSL